MAKHPLYQANLACLTVEINGEAWGSWPVVVSYAPLG